MTFSVTSVQVEVCPSCGATGFMATGPEASGLEANCGGEIFQQPPYSVRECSSCGLLYKDNTTSPAELDEYYAVVDFRKWEIPGLFPTERAALAVLRKLPHGARILDFGCSTG